MNRLLQSVLDSILQNEKLSSEQKAIFSNSLRDADKEFEITAFKLDRTEKVKRTTAILLEETIAELEQKRKAVEEQNHELEIEASLERVRTMAMGMRKPDDLLSVCEIFFTELHSLSFSELRNVMINIYNDDENSFLNYDYSSNAGRTITVMPYNFHPLIEKQVSITRQASDAFYEFSFSGKELKDFRELRKNNGELDDPKLEDTSSLHYYFYSIGTGSIGISTYSAVTAEKLELLKRFRNVFDLAYRRYIDIQQAEVQAKEVRIQLALERVRARTMAMQRSDELSETAYILFQQFRELGEDPIQITIGIFNEEKNLIEFRVTGGNGSGSKIDDSFNASIDEPTLVNKIFRAWKQNKKSETIILEGKELRDWIKYRNEISGKYAYETKVNLNDRRYASIGFFSKGMLSISTTKPVSDETIQILERFASVFDLTYTRFLDLKNAEAQAREAQIQLALERVRARTLAMYKSEELAETAQVLFLQLEDLGVVPDRISIGIVDEAKQVVNFWTTDQKGSHLDSNFSARLNERTVIAKTYKAWKEQQQSLVIDLQGDELKEWIQFAREEMGIVVKDDFFKNRRIHTLAFFSHGWILVSTLEPQSPESIEILERFASVFNLTYTRFLDLQKAEASARESQIEAALEKVRGKAMAMHNSNDLSVTASMVFTELRKLGITPIRCGVGLLNQESRKAQLYSATSSTDGDSLSLVGWVLLEGHPVLEKIYDTWLKNEDYYPELAGQQLQSYYELLLAGLSVKVPDWQDGQKQYGHFFSFSIGCLYAWSESPYDETEIKILKRFASIIDLTFRRYIELQKSEANAREAVKQAALDRVRAEIASMRTVADLEKITPLIWNELTILGIPFIRCGVFIMDDSEQRIHTFLSTPDGKAIAAFHIPYDTPGNIAQVLSHWNDKKNYIDHWDENAFTEFADTLVRQGALSSSAQYLQTIPHGGFYLHFLPFLQGMLYVGNSTQLNEEEIKLIQSLADAFSTAYARYEDFNKLEAAKKQVDYTLNELQATQKQLVQSEKMASLGELTAGIAHEIQNPLNFVNNFSEVSSELLQEMKTELDKGETEEAKTIADDVKQNLEKILYHGKRADAIVKGMLQHSRTSSGQKELTDLNILADEYLRLAYHGLRAKDKTFNAKFETDLDKTIGKINVVPQDIGRVILNLINNAFYAVSEKKKQVVNGYDPTVAVKTRKTADKIFLTVNDNGNGIPQKVLDKIFQPFFTTKPAGEGTGLGLSLSFDIITKGHGGELKVQTKEGEGSEFIIQLPL